MRRRLKREIKATEPRNPDLAAWLKAELAALPPQALVFAAASDFLPDDSHVPPGKPRPVHVLKRGDIHQPGKAAVPGTVSCVDGLPARFSDRDRRRRIGPPRGPGPLDHRSQRTRSPGGRSSTASGTGISAGGWCRHPAISAGWAACRRIPSCSTGWRAGFSSRGARSSRCIA